MSATVTITNAGTARIPALLARRHLHLVARSLLAARPLPSHRPDSTNTTAQLGLRHDQRLSPGSGASASFVHSSPQSPFIDRRWRSNLAAAASSSSSGTATSAPAPSSAAAAAVAAAAAASQDLAESALARADALRQVFPQKMHQLTASVQATSPLLLSKAEDQLASAAMTASTVATPTKALATQQQPSTSKSVPPAAPPALTSVPSFSSTPRTTLVAPAPNLAQRWWRWVVALAKQTWAGLKILRVNIATVKELHQTKPDPSAWTRREYMLVKQTKDDVQILIPFLFCVLILDELLPLLLYMGWVPAPCQTPDQVNTHRQRLLAKRTQAWDHFRRVDPLGYSPYTEFSKIDRPTLQHFCRIMSISAIGPRPMLARRLEAHLTHLSKDDALLVREGIHGLTKEELEVALEQRGFCTAGGRPMEDMQAALKRWLAMTQDRDVTRLQWVVSRAVVKPWSSKVSGSVTIGQQQEGPVSAGVEDRTMRGTSQQ